MRGLPSLQITQGLLVLIVLQDSRWKCPSYGPVMVKVVDLIMAQLWPSYGPAMVKVVDLVMAQLWSSYGGCC